MWGVPVDRNRVEEYKKQIRKLAEPQQEKYRQILSRPGNQEKIKRLSEREFVTECEKLVAFQEEMPLKTPKGELILTYPALASLQNDWSRREAEKLRAPSSMAKYDEHVRTYINACETLNSSSPTLIEWGSVANIPKSTLNKELNDERFLLALKRGLKKKRNWAKPQEKKDFWFEVEERVDELINKFAEKRRKQRELPVDRPERIRAEDNLAELERKTVSPFDQKKVLHPKIKHVRNFVSKLPKCSRCKQPIVEGDDLLRVQNLRFRHCVCSEDT